MKEDDRYRHLSPLVKQDLNLLDANADTRRLAVKSLKLMVKQLDAHTLPRFIFQVIYLILRSTLEQFVNFLTLSPNHDGVELDDNAESCHVHGK